MHNHTHTLSLFLSFFLSFFVWVKLFLGFPLVITRVLVRKCSAPLVFLCIKTSNHLPDDIQSLRKRSKHTKLGPELDHADSWRVDCHRCRLGRPSSVQTSVRVWRRGWGWTRVRHQVPHREQHHHEGGVQKCLQTGHYVRPITKYYIKMKKAEIIWLLSEKRPILLSLY